MKHRNLLLSSMICLLSCSAAWAQSSTASSGAELLKPGTFEGSQSFTLSNGKIGLTFLQQGASMASIVLQDDKEQLNPLWNPVRLNREQGRKADPSSVTGHLICLDGFGPASPEEAQAGLSMHGEAHLQQLEVHSSKSGNTTEVTLTGTLPVFQEKLTRKLRMVDDENVVYVQTQLENLLGFDRPIAWAEHATFGPPFVEAGVTVFDLSGVRSRTTAWTQPSGPNATTERRLASNQDFTWPMAPGRDGKTVDMRQIPDNPHYIEHATTLMDPARDLEWSTALNPKRKLIMGYVFRRSDYPWLMTWGNYPPSNLPVRAMEFATQPFATTRRAAVAMGSMFDTPTYRWMAAKSTITTSFLMFYARVPDGFTKVDDVRLENNQLVIEDHAAKKQLKLAASLKL